MNTPAHLGDDILNAWIDGIATDAERAVVDDHISTCDICLGRLDELQSVKAMLGDLSEIPLPRSFRLTEEQAKRPTPIRPKEQATSVIRLLPIVRTLSVAAMLAVMVLGGVLALGPSDDSLTSDETVTTMGAFQSQNPAREAEPAPGEVVDQGEAASAYDSTAGALDEESAAQEQATIGEDSGLSGLEIATITVGVLAILLGVAWVWISMSIRGGTRP